MPAGTLYRGKVGMWSWVLHRITGVAIFFFLLVHILDSSLLSISPESYNTVINTYKQPVMGVGELGLVGAIVFHALNGVRIILIDFWRKGAKFQNRMFWWVIALAVVLIGGFATHQIPNIITEFQRAAAGN